MADLNFAIEKVEAVRFAATPMLAFRLRVTNADPGEAIYTVALRCQIQIEAARRRYLSADRERLRDLFGEPERWSQTLRPCYGPTRAPSCRSSREASPVVLPVACTFDFNVAATKYFHGIEDGDMPLSLMFSGTVFYRGEDGALQVGPISWDKEARFRLPLAVWKEVMDLHYPNSAWLCLRRDVFDRLHRYKVRRGIPTWEETLETLLAPCEETVPS